MKLRCAVATLAAASVLSVLGAPAVSAAAAGGSCRTTAELAGMGRPKATSRCTGRFASGAQHRAKIICDMVQGAREHVVRRTYRSDWAPTGSAASVGCASKSFLVGFGSEVRGG
ncbi:hypothetical protein [Streptomyces virginiae]